MSTPELRQSWSISLRHLAAARFYLPRDLANDNAAAIWHHAQNYLHHNELGLALECLMDMGEACDAPAAFWNELLFAAENMECRDEADAIRSKL